MAKKTVSASQLAARKKRGAKATRQPSEVVVSQFDELLSRLDKLEGLSRQRIEAETKLYESLEKLVSMRGDNPAIDLAPLQGVLERIEKLSGAKQPVAYDFTFKHRSDGRYESIHAEPKVTKH